MRQDFEGHRAGLNAPAADGEAIDISADDADLAVSSRALFVGTGGDVKVQLLSGAIVTFKNAVGGVTHPWRAKKVFKVGTTAGDLVALW